MATQPSWLCLLAFLGACSVSSDESTAVEAEARGPETARVHTKEILSKTYHIDKKYMSMTGPFGYNHEKLLDVAKPELLWVVGYQSDIVDATSSKKISQEWACHANLDLNTEAYFKEFPTAPSMSGRLFTLSQGQSAIDFPPGFGIPIASDMELSLVTQVLNLNIENPDLDVKHRVQIRFLRDSELTQPITPLFQAAVEGFKALEDARYYGVSMDDAHNPDELGPGCSVGQAAIAGDVDQDSLGQKFSAHWLVEPGREVNRTNVTRFFNLPYDTTAHYIAVHLHPWGESLELRDLTTGESKYLANVTAADGRIGIERVQYYSSPEGMEFHKDHEYEVVSIYNNTSDSNADSMAVMYLYLEDQRFQKPRRLTSQSR